MKHNIASESEQVMESRSAAMIIMLAVCAIILFAFSPNRNDLPASVVSIIGFFLVLVVWPNARPRLETPLCPFNVAWVLFALQLVVLPLLTLHFGFSRGTLMYLPSDYAKNIALLLSTLAFLSFAGAYHFSKARCGPSTHDAHLQTLTRTYPSNAVLLLLLYAIIGLIGFVVFYGSWSQYLSYLTNPTSAKSIRYSVEGTIQGAASTFLIPFLGFFVVLAWSLGIDRYVASERWGAKALATILAAIGLTFINVSFSYNRGAVVGPILALAAAFSSKVRRVSITFLTVVGSLLLSVMLVWGVYRSSNLTFEDLRLQGTLASLNAEADIVDFLQVYFAAPQFSGYLIEQCGFGSNLYWGKTILSSLMYPIPIIGKPFRATSGVEIYNRLIYGSQPAIDQVPPFQAELFINLHIGGVIIMYALLGLLTMQFQKKYEEAQNTFESYSLFLMSAWTLFLIPGSLAVTSQIYIYFFWPIYSYFLLKALMLRRHTQTGISVEQAYT